jgi:hypothetical protein
MGGVRTFGCCCALGYARDVTPVIINPAPVGKLVLGLDAPGTVVYVKDAERVKNVPLKVEPPPAAPLPIPDTMAPAAELTNEEHVEVHVEPVFSKAVDDVTSRSETPARVKLT